MKFEIVLKDPDGIWDSIHAAIVNDLKKDPEISTLGIDVIMDKAEVKLDLTLEQLQEWVYHNEYVTLIYDTDTRQMTVKQRMSKLQSSQNVV